MSYNVSNVAAPKNPRIIIKKSDRILQVFDGNKLIKTYTVVLGFSPKGDKEIEGDGKTPEGEFYICVKNDKSKFHLSLGLSYPNIFDAERGLKENLISRQEYDAILEAFKEKRLPPQSTRLGGEIYIHGGGTLSDWTKGCVALENEEMRELFDTIANGTKVEIFP